MNQFKENDIAITEEYQLVEIKTVIKTYAVNPEREKLEKKIQAYRKAISFGDMKYVNSKLDGIWTDIHLHKCRRILKLLERDLEITKPQVPVYFYEVYYGAEHQIMTVSETALFKLKNAQCFEIRRKSCGKENK